MKLRLLPLAAAVVVLLIAAPSGASGLPLVYLAQDAAGTADGSSCANARAIGFFNTASSWGTGSTQIGPDSAVHLCGTITSQLTARGSGTSGHPVGIVWEPNASLSVCNTAGALVLSGQSYLQIDLGANTSAIACPNNGTGLATAVEAEGIYGSPVENTEIRNGTIGPMYIHTGTASDGTDSTGIHVYGGTNNHFHDLSIHDGRFCVYYAIGDGVVSNDDELDHLTLSACGDTMWYATGDNAGTSNNARIHDNTVTIGINWFDTADAFHMEYLHLFTQAAAGSSLNNVLVYNDFVTGPMPNHMTSFFFVDGSAGAGQGTISGALFNEVYVASTGTAPGDGLIFAAGTGNTFAFYNNTIDCSSNTNSTIASELEGSGSTYTVENNIFENCQYGIANNESGPNITANDNDYFNVGSGGWTWKGKEASTLAAWRTASGQDAASISTDPGLNANYTISSTASAAYHAGANLSSVAITQLASDKAGVERAPSGPWDLGAYTYCTGAACTPVDGGAPDGGPSVDGGSPLDGGPVADGAGPGADGGPKPGDGGSGAGQGDAMGPGDGGGASSAGGSKGGCGCRAAGGGDGEALLGIGLVGVLVAVGRRKRPG